MPEPHVPTTLPSPVDREQFGFVAVDASGAAWRWIDEEMVWVRVGGGTETDDPGDDGRGVLH